MKHFNNAQKIIKNFEYTKKKRESIAKTKKTTKKSKKKEIAQKMNVKYSKTKLRDVKRLKNSNVVKKQFKNFRFSI